ncbi:MAG TPA: hypothetical protein VIL46_06960 [Gemmataceae bacterium]
MTALSSPARRTVRRVLAVAAAAGLAALPFALVPGGLAPQQPPPGAEVSLEYQAARLDEARRKLLATQAERPRIAREVIAGRMSLAEAAREFARLAEWACGPRAGHLPAPEVGFRRLVLAYICAELRERPAELADVLGRLRDEIPPDDEGPPPAASPVRGAGYHALSHRDDSRLLPFPDEPRAPAAAY